MIFPTKERDIQISMVIYKGDRGYERQSIQVEASIHYESNRLILSVNLDKQENKKNDISSFLIGEIAKHNIKVQKTEIGRMEIGLRFCEPIVRFHWSYLKGNDCIHSAELKEICYTGNDEKLNRFRLTATANDLQGYINTLNNQQWREVMCPKEIEYQEKKYVLSHDEDRVWIETKEDNVDNLLNLISFFYAVPVECDIQVVNGLTTIRKTRWNLGEGKWQNMALSQLETEDECYSRFWEYIKLVNKKSSISPKTLIYMQEFVRSQLLDRESKLIIYSAILANMANVKIKEDSYNQISKFLANEHHIAAEKLNEGLLEKKIKKDGTKTIKNFYELRNFFEHQLGSEEARIYLKESRLLERLEIAINIVILHQLGADDVRFDSMFKTNSIFDESIPFGHVFEKLFNGV